MSGMSLKLEGFDELNAKFKESPERVGKLVRSFFDKSAQTVEARAKSLTPVDTGRLRSSITHEIDSSPMPTFAKVGSNVFYAPYVEFGTRPHFPPPGALATWGKRHGGIPSFALARSIAARGTKGAHMLERALMHMRGKVENYLSDLGKALEGDFSR